VRTYIVLEPLSDERMLRKAERVVFLRDKFSWPGLLFAPIWLLMQRLWLGFAFWCAAVTLLGAGVKILEIGVLPGALVLALPSLIVGLEGTQLKQFKLLHAGFGEAAVIIAKDLESAECRFFKGWKMQPERAGFRSSEVQHAPLVENPRSSSSVLGLFPRTWRGR